MNTKELQSPENCLKISADKITFAFKRLKLKLVESKFEENCQRTVKFL